MIEQTIRQTLPEGFQVWFRNGNDGTVEGLEVLGAPVYSVQYHPEASAGPHDSHYLFRQFLDSMKAAAAS